MPHKTYNDLFHRKYKHVISIQPRVQFIKIIDGK